MKLIYIYEKLVKNGYNLNEDRKWAETYSYDNIKVGITEDGFWCFLINKKFLVPVKCQEYGMIISILENDLCKVMEEIAKNYVKEESDLSPMNLIPYKEVLDVCLKYYVNDYWIGYAIDWIEKLEAPIIEQFAYLLNDIYKNKNLSQKLRHRIARIIKTL